MTDLGRLERVDVREIWKTEAQDFTPWLARDENIALLGETIGLELDVQSVEKAVGPFSADILCKDTATDQYVLIENQLERTDHRHLGQLMTYAAGLHAVTIVWIADTFTDEHKAAMDWLNDITGDDFNFFGLEIEIWRIGESAMAPKFNINSKPNEWGIVEPPPPEISELKKLQREFWTHFAAYMAQNSSVTVRKPRPQHWMNMPIGRSEFRLTAVFLTWDSDQEGSPGAVRAEVVLASKRYAKTYFKMLEESKDEIERELGEELTWHNPENRNACKMYVRKSVDVQDKGNWDECCVWFREKLEALHRVFAERIKNLNADEYEDELSEDDD